MNTVMKEPPNYASVHGDRRNLTQYIAALKLWAKVSGVEKKDQADFVKYHAYQTVPEYFEELDAKFGDSLTAQEDGLTKIIKFLEEKFGVSQHSEIVRKLNEFYSCSRQKSEDLVKYTARFEQTYKEVTRIKVAGDKAIVNYSSTALAVLLLRTANLSDVDHQIISRSLNFDEAKKEEEEKTFEKTKAAVISHQVTKTANHQALPSTSAPGGPKNLATFLTEELDLDQEEQDTTADLLTEFKVWFTDKRKAGGGKTDRAGQSKFPPRNNKKQRKCDYCICDHPKWDHSCGCPCTKHTKENCPNPDPEKKKKADLAEIEWRKRRQQKPSGTMMVRETAAPAVAPTVVPAQGEAAGSTAPTSFLNYLNRIEDSVEKTFVVSVKPMPDAVSPTPRAEFLKEMQRLDRMCLGEQEEFGELQYEESTLTSSSTSYDGPDGLVLSPLGEVPLSGESSNIAVTNTNSHSSHDNTDWDEEAINIKTQHGNTTFLVKQSKVFFAAEKEQEQEPEVVLVANIPRSRHGEERCVAAKKKELQDFSDFDVYDIVDLPKDVNVIGTEWVLVEKEGNEGNKVVKARLCARGDLEAGKHMIPVNAPTANKVTIKLLLVLAASRGYDVRTNDVRRAFLQTEDLDRMVYVRPPVEAGLPSNKVWLLRRAIYGLIDASRAYFLRHARELKVLGFSPLQFDPATFVKTKNGEFKAAYASHVDDCLAVGDKKTLDETHNAMAQQLTYGEVQPIPARFLGMNISRNVNGDIIIDQKHYVDELEVPDMQQFKGLVKADVLPEQHQSMFRSLASKLNMLALSSRPDFSFAAKYLTTRYGKATKSDLTRAVKLLTRAKEESTEMIIPNLGDMKDWLVIGISDASNKSSNEIFSVGGHVILLVNKTTEAAAVVHWSSKKITRVVSSSLAAETLGLQQMTGTLYLVRQILEGLCGTQASQIPCLALTDSKNLWSCIHNISSCSDNRLQADVINIRQAIHDDQTIQEVRYIHSSQMLADCLTKQTNLTGQMLLNTVRTGTYTVPGGTTLRDSTLTSVKTWDQLMSAEKQDNDSDLLKTRIFST